MRSTFFERPLEYQLLCTKEEWLQGEPIQGQLSLKNLNKDTVSAEQIRIVLAYGNFRKIKANDADCWEVLQVHKLADSLEIGGGEKQSFDWELTLPTDAPITDKSGSLFLLFGGESVLERGGRLDVRTDMLELLQSFLQTFVTQFHFLQRSVKYKDGWTEVHLDPPTGSREFPNLEHVLCYLRMREEKLEIRYRCKVKTLKRDGENMKVRGKNLEISQVLTAEEYLQASGFPNRAKFREMIDKALTDVKPTVVF